MYPKRRMLCILARRERSRVTSGSDISPAIRQGEALCSVGDHSKADGRAARKHRLERACSDAAQEAQDSARRETNTHVGVILLVALSASVAFAARAWRSGARGESGRNVSRERASAAAKSTAGVLLGDAAVELHDGHLGSGQAEAFRVRALQSGSTGTMYVYVGPQSTAREVAVGIYDNANGRPRWLLNRGVASKPKPDAWTAVPITPTRLVQGTRYWLTVLGVGGTLHYRSRAGAFCLANLNVDDRLQTLPRVWRRDGRGTRARCPISAYVVAGGAAFVPSPPQSQSTPLLLEGPPAVPALGEQLAIATASPANSVLPVVNGSVVEGQTLTTSTGTWSGDPTSYAYQWEDCNTAGEACSNITGATSASYKLAAGDVGHTLRVVVTATNAAARRSQLRDERDRRGGRARERRVAGGERFGGSRSDADHEYWVVVRQPDLLLIPMGGLQHGRRSMFEHHRGDFVQLQARRR